MQPVREGLELLAQPGQLAHVTAVRPRVATLVLSARHGVHGALHGTPSDGIVGQRVDLVADVRAATRYLEAVIVLRSTRVLDDDATTLLDGLGREVVRARVNTC